MKTLPASGKHADNFFHMPPASILFSLITSFVLALLLIMVLLVVPVK
jgi:hypothetical protein